jgi:phenylalanyl-tRNA synthetase beta chain
MRAVWSWLSELAELPRSIEADEGAAILTGGGLEVEQTERLGQGVSGVVVAEVVGREPHPDADKLTLVDVIDAAGGRATRVVCGAPNVPAPGGRVLWARPGAALPGMAIGTRKIKGVESAGMLCSEKELGLGDDHDGIVVLGAGEREVELGASVHQTLRLDDVVLDISVPTNRPDCLGHLGLARELAALTGGRLRPPRAELAALTDEARRAAELARVSIDDPARCPRYVARVIEGLTVGPSPRWLQQRLRAVGVRPLSNLVDVTNYVMFELGQPLHAFDYEKVRGARIVVRSARAGERMKTLDEVERALEPTDLLICDGEGPVALAGVMGGLESEVSAGTTRVLLEAASFEPIGVRRTARRLNLHSESSYRFERGVDPELPELASRRAAELLARLGGGRVVAGAVDAYPRPPEPRTVRMRPSRATRLTGVELPRERCAELLGHLGLEVASEGDDRLAVTVPSYRTDLEREVDLIEDVIRMHGLGKVPSTLPVTAVAPRARGDLRLAMARRALTACGLSEAITFGFTSPARIAALSLPDSDRRAHPIGIRNPMSVEQSVMRTSLYANLLGAVARNLSFQVADVALFEIGHVFLARGAGELPDEPLRVAGVIAGQRAGWLTGGGEVDFFDAKGAVERLLGDLLGPDHDAQPVRFEAASDITYMHPGICARVLLSDGTVLGEVGEVHPRTRDAFELELPVFGFELALDRLPPLTPAQMAEITKYPAVTRDVSFFVAADLPASRVRELIAAAEQPLVEEVRVLEDYRDPDKVPAGQKGMLWSLTYRSSERTLTDAEVDAAHEAIVDRLLRDLPATRR